MKIALFIVYILLILLVIFLERKTPTQALFWVVVMICIPYVGLILYLIFGTTLPIKITAVMRKKRIIKDYKGPINSDVKLDLDVRDVDREVMQFNYTYNQSSLTFYDDASVFTSGMSHYEQLFKDIENAKETIYVLFYTIHNDDVGHKFVEALTKKANDGVKVLLMCDFVANISSPPKMFKPLKKAGGKVIRIKPFLTHYRSHRKLVIIDHAISYIGGMNIGNKYIGKNKKKSPWRDTQVRMTGRACVELEKYFFTDWFCSLRRKYIPYYLNYVNTIKYKSYEPNNNICQFVVGGVDTNKEAIKMTYLSMIRSAKKIIRIQSPYFVPDESILNALKTAVASGVKVEFMLPKCKSSFFLDPVTTYYIGDLLEYGATIYKYDGYVHAKTMIIDDELCCIGSVNMDIRSMSVDDEICGVFFNNDFVSKYQDIYNEDLKRCEVYTYDEFKTRSFKEKVLENFFRLFSALM